MQSFKYYTVYFAILFIFFGFSSHAQFRSVTTPILTNGGIIYTTTHVYAPDSYKPTGFKGFKLKSNTKQYYTVTLLNDEVITIYSKIEVGDTAVYLSSKKGGTKRVIIPHETTSISIEGNYGKITGVPVGSRWFFKIISGNINVYSYLPETNWDFVVGIQRGEDSPIVEFNSKNLRILMLDYKYSVDLIQLGQFENAIEAYNNRRD